jgi:hypothetical protein
MMEHPIQCPHWGNGRDAAMRRNKIPLYRTGNDCIVCSYSAEISASARSR